MMPEKTRPLSELRTSGLLWLINASVLHARGFGLALVFDDDGNVTGWQLLGDGSEPWTFLDKECDDQFAAVNDLFIGQRGKLDQISSWHSRETADGGMVGDFCNECGQLWPCDTRLMIDR